MGFHFVRARCPLSVLPAGLSLPADLRSSRTALQVDSPPNPSHSRDIVSVSRAGATALAALCCLSFAQPAAADPTRFDFALFTTTNFGGSFLFPDGGGSFVVDDPIPASGTVVLVASDMSGTAGVALNSPAPFGYAFGNTFEYFVGPPPEGNIAVTRTPHQDALITFRDGVAVGVSYQESHSCDTGHHCQPSFTQAGSIFMSGTFYDFSPGVYPLVTAGPFTITREVPEPGTGLLLLCGLLALVFSSNGRRRRSVTPGRSTPMAAASGAPVRRRGGRRLRSL